MLYVSTSDKWLFDNNYWFPDRYLFDNNYWYPGRYLFDNNYWFPGWYLFDNNYWYPGQYLFDNNYKESLIQLIQIVLVGANVSLVVVVQEKLI